RGGREIVSTPEHTHFAGYRLGLTPQLHMTSLMRDAGRGCRVGVTRASTDAVRTPMIGIQQRSGQEHADAAWVVSVHASLDVEHPHHAPAPHEGRRRNVTITLCGDRRGRTPMHRATMAGRDPDVRARLEAAGLPVRPARNGGWRIETCFKQFDDAVRLADRIRRVTDVSVRYSARLGAPSPGLKNALPFMPASSVRPGMAMFTADGAYDVVERVERIELDRPVYDLNVEATHNFVAEGLVTHNSIYAFRGADIRNILDFEDDFPDAAVIKLEQNYRSTQTILSAANALIENNRSQKRKELWTDAGDGDEIVVRELEDEHAEARYVAGEIERLVDAGGSRDEVAVFYRANAQSRVLEDTLVRYGVGYQVIGGTRFYERAEIKDALGYLTFLVNPQDLVAFQRVVNSPRRGIGDTTQARIAGHANT